MKAIIKDEMTRLRFTEEYKNFTFVKEFVEGGFSRNTRRRRNTAMIFNPREFS